MAKRALPSANRTSSVVGGAARAATRLGSAAFNKMFPTLGRIMDRAAGSKVDREETDSKRTRSSLNATFNKNNDTFSAIVDAQSRQNQLLEQILSGLKRSSNSQSASLLPGLLGGDNGSNIPDLPGLDRPQRQQRPTPSAENRQRPNTRPRSRWSKFMRFVRRRSAALFGRVGVKLAASASLATIPVAGWLAAAVTIGLAFSDVYALIQLWREFNSLSENEQDDDEDDDQTPSPPPPSPEELATAERQQEAVRENLGDVSQMGDTQNVTQAEQPVIQQQEAQSERRREQAGITENLEDPERQRLIEAHAQSQRDLTRNNTAINRNRVTNTRTALDNYNRQHPVSETDATRIQQPSAPVTVAQPPAPETVATPSAAPVVATPPPATQTSLTPPNPSAAVASPATPVATPAPAAPSPVATITAPVAPTAVPEPAAPTQSVTAPASVASVAAPASVASVAAPKPAVPKPAEPVSNPEPVAAAAAAPVAKPETAATLSAPAPVSSPPAAEPPPPTPIKTTATVPQPAPPAATPVTTPPPSTPPPPTQPAETPLPAATPVVTPPVTPAAEPAVKQPSAATPVVTPPVTPAAPSGPRETPPEIQTESEADEEVPMMELEVSADRETGAQTSRWNILEKNAGKPSKQAELPESFNAIRLEGNTLIYDFDKIRYEAGLIKFEGEGATSRPSASPVNRPSPAAAAPPPPPPPASADRAPPAGSSGTDATPVSAGPASAPTGGGNATGTDTPAISAGAASAPTGGGNATGNDTAGISAGPASAPTGGGNATGNDATRVSTSTSAGQPQATAERQMPQVTGTTAQILSTIRNKESGGNYQAQARGSSASGAYQFIDGTWQSLTRRFNIGTEFRRAVEAPQNVQDALAAAYVNDILSKNNNNVAVVPLVWYTGNAQGRMSTAALAANRGLTAEMYQQRWLADFARQGGSAPQTPVAQAPTTGQTMVQASTTRVVADREQVRNSQRITSSFNQQSAQTQQPSNVSAPAAAPVGEVPLRVRMLSTFNQLAQAS